MFKNRRLAVMGAFLAGLFPHSQSVPNVKRKPVGHAAKSEALQEKLKTEAEAKRIRRRARNRLNRYSTKRYAHQ